VRNLAQLSRTSIAVVGLAALGAVPSAAFASTGRTIAARTQATTTLAGEVPAAASSQNSNYLSAVAALSSSMAWAVGWWESASRTGTLIERWNGTAWDIVKSPNPARGFPGLEAVAAPSPSSAWAVGFIEDVSADTSTTLIDHWNGATWERVQSPNPASSKAGNQLFGVAASSASSAWAVGRAGDSPLIEHWTGRAWKVVASPLPRRTKGTLSAVTALSSMNAWAVGSYTRGKVDLPLVEHWNGRTWRIVPARGRSRYGMLLSGVTAISASDVWAVGSRGQTGDVSHLLIEHWNGRGWKIVPAATPGPGWGGEFSQVAAASPEDIWAVGSDYYAVPNGGSLPLIEHWNGTSWQQVPAPGSDSASFAGVAAVSATSAWEVGTYHPGRVPQTLIAGWNGTAWALVPSADR
jgi:hypothetical protein